MSSSNSPCAACKFLRRKCTQECVFAPYFPADQPHRFANVHKVFGASNVAKLLNELDKSHREDAVNSLAYEADARLRDPVYGCVGLISLLQHSLKQLQVNLDLAKKELASIVGPAAMMQMVQNPYFQSQYHPALSAAPSSSNPSAMVPYNMAQMMGMVPTGPGPNPLVIADPQQQQQQQIGGQLMMREAVQHQQQQQQIGGQLVIPQHQQHSMEAQQLAAAMQVREEQEIMRSFEQQHAHIHHAQQQELLRFNGNGYEQTGGTVNGDFGQMEPPDAAMSPLLALGSGFDGNSYQQDHQQPLLLLQQPQQSESEAGPHTSEHHHQPQQQLFHDHHHHPAGSGNDEEGRAVVHPSNC